MISRFADALLAVFNGFRRAEADARHTVSAILAPDRFTVFQFNVVERAHFCTLAASDALVICRKGVRLDKEFIEHRVDYIAHKLIISISARLSKFLFGFYSL